MSLRRLLEPTSFAGSSSTRPLGYEGRVGEDIGKEAVFNASNQDERETFKIMVCKPPQSILGTIA